MATTTIDITTTVTNTVTFLNEMLLDAEEGMTKRGMIADYSNNLIKVINGSTFDLPDATNALKALRDNRAMLGEENMENIKQAISRSVSYTHLTLPTKRIV